MLNAKKKTIVEAVAANLAKGEVLPPETNNASHADTPLAVLVDDEVETGLDIPAMLRGSKYDFKLDTLKQGQSRFVAVDGDENAFNTVDTAIRSHIDRERKLPTREGKDNFVIRPAEKNGQKGFRVYCVSIEQKPLRKPNKKSATPENQVQAA